MASKKVQIPFGGKIVSGTEIDVTETIDRATEITLADGSRLRMKSSVISAVRIDGEYDPDGNPMYLVNAAPVLSIIDIPDKLKRNK